MARSKRISLDGKEYVWINGEWYDANHFLPPAKVLHQLNRVLERELSAEDATISNVGELIRRASIARDGSQYSRAESLIRRALKMAPDNCYALAVLCSILRALGKPQQALDETDGFKRASCAPLLTSRAAALCDVGRWEQAKNEVGHSLAIEETEEAFNVVHRIKAERPDLYR